jgi:hypothetical protein
MNYKIYIPSNHTEVRRKLVDLFRKRAQELGYNAPNSHIIYSNLKYYYIGQKIDGSPYDHGTCTSSSKRSDISTEIEWYDFLTNDGFKKKSHISVGGFKVEKSADKLIIGCEEFNKDYADSLIEWAKIVLKTKKLPFAGSYIRAYGVHELVQQIVERAKELGYYVALRPHDMFISCIFLSDNGQLYAGSNISKVKETTLTEFFNKSNTPTHIDHFGDFKFDGTKFWFKNNESLTIQEARQIIEYWEQ